MGVEIERKFLLLNDNWREQVEKSEDMRQGYLQRDEQSAIRVRVSGEQAHINIKSTRDGIYRMEYEYVIPLADAHELLDQLADKPLIEKRRHHIHHQGMLWEIDEFFGDNQGLIVAEIELDAVDQAFAKPDWIGEEVSEDKRYFNSALVSHPFCNW